MGSAVPVLNGAGVCVVAARESEPREGNGTGALFEHARENGIVDGTRGAEDDWMKARCCGLVERCLIARGADAMHGRPVRAGPSHPDRRIQRVAR